MGVQRALVGVPDRGQAVQAVVGGGEEHPASGSSRPGPARPRRAGAARPAERRTRGGVAFHAQHGVAAPGDVGQRPSVRGGEALGAQHHHRRGVQPGRRPGLPHPEPVGDGIALGRTLALVPPGEVEGLDQLVGGREDHLQPVQHVGTRTGVGHRVAAAESAACHGLELGDEGESRLGVGSGQPEPVVSGVEGVPDEAGRPGGTGPRRSGPADATRWPRGCGRADSRVRARRAAASPARSAPGETGGSAVGRQPRPQHDGEAVAGVVELEAGARGGGGGGGGRAWGASPRSGGGGGGWMLKRECPDR